MPSPRPMRAAPRAAGHEVTEISVGALDFPILRSTAEFETGTLPASLAPSQAAIREADHLLIVYRWYFGAHGLKSLERSILGFAGIGPIRESPFGMIEQASEAKRRAWLAKLRRLGADAA